MWFSFRSSVNEHLNFLRYDVLTISKYWGFEEAFCLSIQGGPLQLGRLFCTAVRTSDPAFCTFMETCSLLQKCCGNTGSEFPLNVCEFVKKLPALAAS